MITVHSGWLHWLMSVYLTGSGAVMGAIVGAVICAAAVYSMFHGSVAIGVVFMGVGVAFIYAGKRR